MQGIEESLLVLYDSLLRKSRLARGRDGRFKDADLARILQDATETVAEAPGYRIASSTVRESEVELVDQGRRLSTCTLNDYRRSLGLKRSSQLMFKLFFFNQLNSLRSLHFIFTMEF